MTSLVITGGYGFIGSNAVNWFCDHGYDVRIVDAKTYAADPARVRYPAPADVCTVGDVFWAEYLRGHGVKCVINFAAESHVDNSIRDGGAFMKSNCLDVQHLVSQLTEYYKRFNEKIYLIHISTDEVYGDLPYTSYDTFSEESPLRPNNPYSAAKAAADLVIQAYHHTFKSFDYTILRSCNNFGPGQHREKFLPTMIRSLLRKQKIPVYGTGSNIREWIYVQDFVEVIHRFVAEWENGNVVTEQVFNVTSDYDLSNLEMVRHVLSQMGIAPGDYEKHVEFVVDRQGHDRKYLLNASKLRRRFGVSPRYSEEDFYSLLRTTIADVQQQLAREGNDGR